MVKFEELIVIGERTGLGFWDSMEAAALSQIARDSKGITSHPLDRIIRTNTIADPKVNVTTPTDEEKLLSSDFDPQKPVLDPLLGVDNQPKLDEMKWQEKNEIPPWDDEFDWGEYDINPRLLVQVQDELDGILKAGATSVVPSDLSAETLQILTEAGAVIDSSQPTETQIGKAFDSNPALLSNAIQDNPGAFGLEGSLLGNTGTVDESLLGTGSDDVANKEQIASAPGFFQALVDAQAAGTLTPTQSRQVNEAIAAQQATNTGGTQGTGGTGTTDVTGGDFSGGFFNGFTGGTTTGGGTGGLVIRTRDRVAPSVTVPEGTDIDAILDRFANGAVAQPGGLLGLGPGPVVTPSAPPVQTDIGGGATIDGPIDTGGGGTTTGPGPGTGGGVIVDPDIIIPPFVPDPPPEDPSTPRTPFIMPDNPVPVNPHTPTDFGQPDPQLVLNPANPQLLAPQVIPASNSGQATFSQYLEEFQNGLLGSGTPIGGGLI